MTETAQTIKDTVETLAPYLDKLADNIGNNGTYVFGLMVKQAYITGITDLIYGLMFIILLIIGYIVSRKVEGWTDRKETVYNWILLLVLFASLFPFTAFLKKFPEMITCLANPEYQAVIQLLHAIK